MTSEEIKRNIKKNRVLLFMKKYKDLKRRDLQKKAHFCTGEEFIWVVETLIDEGEIETYFVKGRTNKTCYVRLK